MGYGNDEGIYKQNNARIAERLFCSDKKLFNSLNSHVLSSSIEYILSTLSNEFNARFFKVKENSFWPLKLVYVFNMFY